MSQHVADNLLRHRGAQHFDRARMTEDGGAALTSRLDASVTEPPPNHAVKLIELSVGRACTHEDLPDIGRGTPGAQIGEHRFADRLKKGQECAGPRFVVMHMDGFRSPVDIHDPEIGRAWGSERGCQYVGIWVCGGYSKKKKNQ